MANILENAVQLSQNNRTISEQILSMAKELPKYVEPTPTQEKTVTAGTEVITVFPDEGYAMSLVTVNPTSSESKSVTPTTSVQTVTPSEGKLLSSVVVNGDAELKSENIREGIDIFGVLGAMSEGVDLMSLVGCTQMDMFELTPSSDRTIYSTQGAISHNLGVVPKCIIALGNFENMTTFPDGPYLGQFISYGKVSSDSDYSSFGGTAIGLVSAGAIAGRLFVSNNSFYVGYAFSGGGSTSFSSIRETIKLRAGVTYTFFVMA